MQTGSARAAFAMVVGGITKIFGRHGDFYRIAGHRIAEIDGFNPETVPPFDEFAMLGPADPGEGLRHLRPLPRAPGGDHRRQQHQRRGARDEPGHARRQGDSPARAPRQPHGARRRADPVRGHPRQRTSRRTSRLRTGPPKRRRREPLSPQHLASRRPRARQRRSCSASWICSLAHVELADARSWAARQPPQPFTALTARHQNSKSSGVDAPVGADHLHPQPGGMSS